MPFPRPLLPLLIVVASTGAAEPSTGPASSPAADPTAGGLCIHPRYPLADEPGAFVASTDYTVTVDGHDAPVYAFPAKRLHWGRDKAVPSTTGSFVPFDCSGPVQVTVEASTPVSRAVVRPLSTGIVPVVAGRTVTFSMTVPKPVMLEINDTEPAGDTSPPRPLFVLASPIRSAPAATATLTPSSLYSLGWPKEPGTYVFEPGRYAIGVLHLHSGQHLHLKPGSLLQGTIRAVDCEDVAITGTGIIDGSTTPSRNGLQFDFTRCSRVAVDGPLIYNSPHWTVTAWNCHDMAISRIKVLNADRGKMANGDGTDICNSQRVSILDCFYYATDDCVSLKGCTWWHDSADRQNLEDVSISGCTLMTSIGYGVRIGDETRAAEMKRISIRDCDAYLSGTTVGINVADRARVSQVDIENMRIERYAGWVVSGSVHRNEYSKDNELGAIQDILVKDVSVMRRFGEGGSQFFGQSANAAVRGVVFENLRVEGREIAGIDQIPGRIWTERSPPTRPLNDAFVFDLGYRTGTPRISAVPSRDGHAQIISLTSPSTGAQCYFTTDGSAPSAGNGSLYGGIPVVLPSGERETVIRVVAVAAGMAPSVTVEKILPRFPDAAAPSAGSSEP